ncbi:MAG: hypothetical protein AAGE52_15215 [Myxococcota bacterium]
MARRARTILLLALVSTTASAQETIDDNDYEIDAIATPVLASNRIVGLAGAYTSLAEGVDGVPFNPAGYAARSAWELDRIEWEITGSILFPGSFSDADFFNNGEGVGFGIESFIFFGVGARLQFNDIGFGALLNWQIYDTNTVGTSVQFLNINVGAGYGLLDGQLVLGLGGRVVNMSITQDDVPIIEFTGAGAEIGALLRLADTPFRIGLAARTPVNSTVLPDETGAAPRAVEGFTLPRAVYLPWEVQAGFSFQVGPRPFNRRHIRIKKVEAAYNDAYLAERCEREREQVLREFQARGETAPELRCPDLAVRAQDREWRRAEQLRRRELQDEADEAADRAEDDLYDLWEELYESMPRRYFLVSVDLLLQGPTDDGVGVDAFLSQQRRPRGADWQVGFRVGIEGEPWENRLKVRAGSYVEPGRYVGVDPRIHGTFGFDLRLFELLNINWRAGFTIDGARDYVSWGFTFGVWH